MSILDHADSTHAIYDITDPQYWDPASLRQETDRVFDICVGCRLCFNLCPSFPALFNTIDGQGDARRARAEEEGRVGQLADRIDYLDLPEGEHAIAASDEVEFVGHVEDMTSDEQWAVVELCYQCKLCDPICPYTPGKEHDFRLDFPRLILRSQAVRTRQQGKKLADRFLEATDTTGKLGTLLAPLSNWANVISPMRFLMEKMTGISRRRRLPKFHRTTFEKWFKKHRRQIPTPEHPVGKVAIFATCYTNANTPDMGQTAVDILEHNNVEVQFVEQRCCGAPYLSSGDFAGFKAQAQPNLDELADWVDRGYKIVVTGPPTCSLTIRDDYVYLAGADQDLAMKIAKVAANTLDISQYLMMLHKAEQLKTDFKHELGEVNYHLSCHMKAQKAGYKSRDLLRLVPGTKVKMVDQCSGMDGGWGMKAEFFDESMKVANKLVKKLNQHDCDHTCSDCSLAGLQIHQASDGCIESCHPIELIHQAYGLGE